MSGTIDFLTDDKDIDLYDIEWLMSNVDLEAVLDRLGVQIEFRRGQWLWGYCPDHIEYTGREPSHPKWSVNEETGMTKCFTEPRVSNLVFTVARLKKISPFRAAEWILGYPINSVQARCSRIKKLMSPKGLNRRADAFEIDKYKKYIENGILGSNSIALLTKNNIFPETAKNFGCVEFQDGYYSNRMIFPIRDTSKKMVGFVATATLDEKDWLKENPTTIDSKFKRKRKTTKEDYRKVLYPKNFQVGKHLLGVDTFKLGDIAILVEGCRDVMKLRQEGFSGSLGLGSTNLSDEQYLILSKLAPKKLMIMLDGDEGGRVGAEKIAEKCLSLFGEVYIIRLPSGVDPKDLSREEVLFHMRKHTERMYENFASSKLGKSSS